MEVAKEAVFVGLYGVAVGCTVILVFPGLRQKLWEWAGWQLYAFNLGRKIEEGRTTWQRLPAWRKEGLIVRGLADEKGLLPPRRQAA